MFFENKDYANNSPQDVIVKIGEVVDTYDEYDGMRIKVRIEQDNNVAVKDLPYAFPLLPKTLQSMPKKGEAVLVILSKLSNKNSIRYYIGPLLSQPQFYYEEKYNGGNGTSNSLLQGSVKKPLGGISKNDMTRGAFPNKEDVAILGRKSEDIILKDGEIVMRCGIRGKPITEEDDSLQGDIFFNTQSPSYLQLKYKRGLIKSNGQVVNSVANLVADKINLISHQDVNGFNLTNQDELIPLEDLENIMSKLHQVPYGDVLVDFLNILRGAVVNHMHAFPGLPPVPCPYVTEALGFDLNKILSDNVRIS